MKKITTLMLLAGLSVPAMGALMVVDGQGAREIASDNDFKADLESLGLNSIYSEGADLQADQDGTLVFRYHGAESRFRNQFVIDAKIDGTDVEPGTVLVEEKNESFDATGVIIGEAKIEAGQTLRDLGIGFDVRNGDETQRDAPAGAPGFGVYFFSKGEPEGPQHALDNGGDNTQITDFFVLGFDDAFFDDDHDDMIVSVTFIPVPEPGSLALLGLGAMFVMGRRRRA